VTGSAGATGLAQRGAAAAGAGLAATGTVKAARITVTKASGRRPAGIVRMLST
jgi:hypothetical protein